jgi:hypothetical protein
MPRTADPYNWVLMSVLWLLPIVVLAAGAVAVAAALRETQEELDGVRQSLADYAEVATAVDALRADLDAARAAIGLGTHG